MLEFNLTRKHAGVEIWGDTWALRQVHELIHRVNEESPLIENKEGLFLGLAYDIRKAYEGQRETATRAHFEDTCPIYGVQILWPILIAQVGLLRESMAFIPTNRGEQAIVYELEYLIEVAVKKALPGKDDEIMDLMRRIGQNQSHIETVLNSRCLFYINLDPKKRLKMLPEILRSMDHMFDFMSKRNIGPSAPDSLSHKDFEVYTDDGSDWPDFQW